MSGTASLRLIANWKANLAPGEEVELARQIALRGSARQLAPGSLLIAPSAIGLVAVASLLRREHAELKIGVVAQDCSSDDPGARTGEIPASHLIGVADAVILGHSERRARGEDGRVIGAKVARCIDAGIVPIVCLGDLDARATDVERCDAVVDQWRGVLAGAAALQREEAAVSTSGIIIAYEPVWAIGSGRPARPETVAAVACALRSEAALTSAPLLYGGSVDGRSAAGYVGGSGAERVDGLLIGGASLEIESLFQIAAAVGVSR